VWVTDSFFSPPFCVAVTVKECSPVVEVEIRPPLGTVPVQELISMGSVSGSASQE
jgi:hypothetical protein